MRTYKHYRPREVWLPLILLTVIGVAALGGLLWSVARASDDAPPWPVFLIAVGVVGINLWLLGRGAVEIRLDDEGYVEFLGPLRRTRIPVLAIESIKPSEMSQTHLFVLKHSEGTLRFDPRFDGMHELVAEIKRLNPNVELRGI